MPAGGVSMAEFQADEAACQPYAERASRSAYSAEGWNSFGRSLLAAGLGATMGASIGSGFGMAGYGAQVGATYGIAAGTGYGYNSQQAASQQGYNIAYMQCMRTKGHKLPGYQSIDDQPSRAAVSRAAPQCADAMVRALCPLYQVRAGVYRAKCQDGSGVEVGTA